MSDHNYNQNILIGAAVAAGILGTLTGLLGIKKQSRGWTDQAKDIADRVMESGDIMNTKMILGGLAGGVVGAAAALLLAPKAGADLIKDLAKPFSDHVKSSRSTSSKSSAQKSGSKKASSKKSGELKVSSAKSEKKSKKKSSSSRRRTAAAPKASAHSEKGAHEAKETAS